MRSLLLLLVTIFLSTTVCAQSIEWSKALGGGDNDGAFCARQTKDGGYIMAGYATSDDGDLSGRVSDGDEDVWVVKLSASGAIEWKKYFGGSDDDVAYWIDETPDGYIVAAAALSTDRDVTDHLDSYDYWILKLNASGEVQWKKSYGGAEEDDPQMVRHLSDGGYLIAGYSSSSDGNVTDNHGFSDFWILKITEQGTIQWAKSYGGSQDDKAVGFRETADKGFIIAGFSYSSNGDVTGHHASPSPGTPSSDGWVIKINKDGMLQWQHSIGGQLDDQFDDIELTDDGGCLLVGYTHSSDGDLSLLGHFGGANLSDGWIVKLTAAGAIEWTKIFGGKDDDELYNIVKCSDGTFAIAGYTASDDIDNLTQHGIADYWVLRITKDGNIVQQMTYGGSDYDQLYSIAQTTDKGFILGGYTISSDQQVVGNHTDTTTDAWIVKIKQDPASVATISDREATVYPNPLQNHSLFLLPISFAASHSVTFSLVNDLGIEFRKETLLKGDNYLTLERGSLAAGQYHYRFLREDGVSLSGNLLVQ